MTPATPAPECAPPDRESLLPCPCCDGVARFDRVPDDEDDQNSGGEYVECGSCGLTTSLRFACGDEVRPLLAEAWNRRVAPAHPPQPVDAEVVEAVRVASSLNWAPRYRSLLMRALAILRGEPDPAGG
jgi:hypothetical protein